MKIKEVPKSFEYQCDGCSAWHQQKGANGHYTNSTPPGWMYLSVKHGHGEYGVGALVANNEYLFCEKCKEGIQKSILNNLDEIPF